jgi:hypothetical protein
MNDLLGANIFSGFSSWKAISYQGEVTPKLLKFEVTTGEENSQLLYLSAIMSKEEKMAWQSFQDVLEHTMGLAQKNLRGFFGFDVLSVDLRDGMKNFDPKALSQLLINHSRGLGPDQKVLIRYGQLFALLHYRAPAEWGKVEVKTHVEFLNPGAASEGVTEDSVRAALMGTGTRNKKSAGDHPDFFLKKLLKESGRESRALYFIHDLSAHPVWDFGHKVHQERIRLWVEKEQQTGLPEIYLQHASARIRLDQR